MTDYEMMFSPGGIVAVNVETTEWLVREVLRLRKVLEAAADIADRHSYEAAQAIRRSLAVSNGERQ